MPQRSGLTGKGSLIVLGLFLMVLAAGAMLQLIKTNGPGPSSPQQDATTMPVSATGFRGFTLQLQSGWEGNPYETYIDQIAATGANTIAFVVAAYQENGSSSCMFMDLRRTPSDVRLRELIDRARGKGLNATLMPIVLLENGREDEWRGKIAPDDWDLWWKNYSDVVLRYARIAESCGVAVYIVGSELISTETQDGRWRGLIAEVRKVYGGRLAYSANWDHYRPIQWWDALDIIGMTTYYDLTDGKEPTVEQLLTAWEPIKSELLAWQGTINRPILFTEVGWPNQETCAQYPWNYFGSDTPDPQAQANCFEAFFRTWIGEPVVAGFVIWEWQSHPKQPTGPEDVGYIPAGKPAMQVITRYLNGGDGSSTSAAPTEETPPEEASAEEAPPS